MTKSEPGGGGGGGGGGARHISPAEWISDYFSPVVSVLSSPDAEAVCARDMPLFFKIPFQVLNDVGI